MKYNFSWDEDGHYVNVCFGNMSVGIISHTKAGHEKFSRWENVEHTVDYDTLWCDFNEFFAETRE